MANLVFHRFIRGKPCIESRANPPGGESARYYFCSQDRRGYPHGCGQPWVGIRTGGGSAAEWSDDHHSDASQYFGQDGDGQNGDEWPRTWGMGQHPF